MDRFDCLVVGAGFAGAVMAERLASAGKSVLVIDQRNHIGGNAYDYYDDAGIRVNKYGAHIFHTNSQAVWDYLSQFTEWRPYVHRVLAYVGGTSFVPVPINDTTLAHFGGDEQAAREAIIRPYTRKQWGCEPEALDPGVLARVKTRPGTDDRYFADTYQAMPRHGYTRLFERLLAHLKIKILLKTSYREIAPYLQVEDEFYSGPIDEFFNYELGKLPYRSARFAFETTRSAGHMLPAPVVNYPREGTAYTRVAEFRQMTGQPHEQTTLCYEYPTAEGEPYWPVPKPENTALYKRYRALAHQLRGLPRVHFLGRLGSYQYLNMDQVVAQSLKVSKTFLEGGQHAESVDHEVVA